MSGLHKPKSKGMWNKDTNYGSCPRVRVQWWVSVTAHRTMQQAMWWTVTGHQTGAQGKSYRLFSMTWQRRTERGCRNSVLHIAYTYSIHFYSAVSTAGWQMLCEVLVNKKADCWATKQADLTICGMKHYIDVRVISVSILGFHGRRWWRPNSSFYFSVRLKGPRGIAINCNLDSGRYGVQLRISHSASLDQ
jgi:hypothetical protein